VTSLQRLDIVRKSNFIKSISGQWRVFWWQLYRVYTLICSAYTIVDFSWLIANF
jgi:hypothetical protein